MNHALVPNPALYGVPFTTDAFHGMPYRRLGHSGLRASAIGLGTWKFGFPDTGDGARVDEDAAFAILDRAYELGVTFWDTANRYNNASGNSERILGRWLKRHAAERRNIVLATKIFGGMDGVSPNHSRLGRANILDSVYASLERLQVARLDLLYFHRYEAETPLEESLAAIEDLVQRDLVRYFAVSNFTVDQLRLYQTVAARDFVRCHPVAVQNQYDPLHGEPEMRGVLAWCAEHRVSFIPFSPLARGLLTNRYLAPDQAKAGDRLVDEGTLAKDLAGNTLDRLRQVAKLAAEYGLEVSQLTLAYLLAQPGMGPQIPSATTVAQVESNAAAGRVTLTPAQLAAVRQAFAG
jgi:aryl-alcohol dehydrogenase-like predicted oxidoreductase